MPSLVRAWPLRRVSRKKDCGCYVKYVGEVTRRQCSHNPVLDNNDNMRDYLICCYFIRGQRMGAWPLMLIAFNDHDHDFLPSDICSLDADFLRDMAWPPDTHPSFHNAFMDGKFIVQHSAKGHCLWHLIRVRSISSSFLWRIVEQIDFLDNKRRRRSLSCQNLKYWGILSSLSVPVSLPQVNKKVWSIQFPQQRNNKSSTIILKICDLATKGTMVNPFKITVAVVVTLDTGKGMDPVIIDCLRKARSIGKDMYTEFMSSVYRKKNKSPC